MYLTIKNFKDRNEGESVWKYFKAGQDFQSQDKDKIQRLLREGLIVEKAKSLDAQAASLDREIEKKQKEAQALKLQADAIRKAANGLKPQPAPQPPKAG